MDPFVVMFTRLYNMFSEMTFPTLEVLLMLVKKRKIANYRQCVPSN